MPLVDGEYEKLTEEEIFRRLESALEEELGATANAGSLVTKQLEAEARTLAENQEEALKRVHQAAYLADATGDELDKVVDVIGLTRIDATSATGVVRLSRENPPTSTYTIPRGSNVQTGGTDPIEFVVRDKDKLAYISGWESDGFNGWNQDTSSFSILTTSEMSGEKALEVPATAGVNITTDDTTFGIGTTFTQDVKPAAGSITNFRFALQDQSNYLECELRESSQDLKLRVVEDGTEATLSENNSATIPADTKSHLEIEWGRYKETKAVLYESKSRDTELSSVSLDESKEWEEGAYSISSDDSTATCLVDEISTRSVLVNIQAVNSGSQTNVGPSSITVMPSGITGVEEVSNPIQTGNPNLRDADFSTLILGKDEESDEDLRERGFNSTSIGGSATVNALDAELKRVEGVDALTLKRNREENSVNGLPPHSFEAIVYGGTDKAVAEAIFNTASIDSHDVGGINGTEASYKITSDVTKADETISWSRPLTLDLNITLDLIVDENFIGEAEVSSIVANYVGGDDVDGSFVNGLSVGEDVYQAVLSRRIVNPDETGVWEVDSMTIDSDGDGTDDTTAAASGAEVLAVADNEVAVTDARDGSITVNTTLK
jgi:uncharacterized phage protein gp47/JayE